MVTILVYLPGWGEHWHPGKGGRPLRHDTLRTEEAQQTLFLHHLSWTGMVVIVTIAIVTDCLAHEFPVIKCHTMLSQYQHYTWNGVWCSDKYRKACYVKHWMCALPAIKKDQSFDWFKWFCAFWHYIISHILSLPNINFVGPTNGLSIRQLSIPCAFFYEQTLYVPDKSATTATTTATRHVSESSNEDSTKSDSVFGSPVNKPKMVR